MQEYTVKSFKDYVNYTEEYKGTYYFRGQANIEWSIIPNIFRDEDKLKNEIKYINKKKFESNFEGLSHILKLQHYGEGTRLCDLTVNPLVGLYFALEDTELDTKDSVVYIFDSSKCIGIDSIELKVLLILTTNEVSTLFDLQKTVKESIGEKIDETLLCDMINSNYIINYDRKLAYSNQRSLLQGGTGLFFGFGIVNGRIQRKNSIDLNMITKKIIIPSTLKKAFRESLSNYGFRKDVLYDEVSKSFKKLEYEVIIKNKFIKSDFTKIILFIKLSDVVFVKEDIESITNEVFSNIKNKYGANTRTFMFVYYDDEDERCANWISMTKNSKDFITFYLEYNKDYHSRRMIYLNNEISKKEVIARTEPIVEFCRVQMDYTLALFKSFSNDSNFFDEYISELKKIMSIMYKLVMKDLQSIFHAGIELDNYYNTSDEFCVNVYSLISNQAHFGGENIDYTRMKDIFNIDYNNCVSSYRKYKIIKDSISMQT